MVVVVVEERRWWRKKEMVLKEGGSPFYAPWGFEKMSFTAALA